MGIVRTLAVGALLAWVGIATADDGPPGMTAVGTPKREYGVGYFRGIGQGYYGASLAYAWTNQLTPDLHVFAIIDDGGNGFALAPELKYCLIPGFRSSPCIAGGMQYIRMWFGDTSGGGFGGHGRFGWALRFEPGIEIEFGIGLHGKQRISGTSGMVTVEQRGTFGPHWDAGIRYWF